MVGLVPSTMDLFCNGASLLAIAFGVDFTDRLGLALKFSEQPHIFVLVDKLDFFDATKPSCVSELSVSP